MFGRIILAGVLAMSFAPAAQAAEGLDCALNALSTENRAVLELDFSARNQADSERATSALFQAVSDCADQHHWSPEATEDVTYFSLFKPVFDNLVTHSPLSASQMSRLVRTVDIADRADMAAALDPLIARGMGGESGEDAVVPPASVRFFVQVTLRAAIPMNEVNQEYIGAYLAARHVTESRALSFASR